MGERDKLFTKKRASALAVAAALAVGLGAGMPAAAFADEDVLPGANTPEQIAGEAPVVSDISVSSVVASLPANRTVSGKIKLPAEMTAAQKADIRVVATSHGNLGNTDRCGGGGENFKGSINVATGGWEVKGLGDCDYEVSIMVGPSKTTNNWSFSLTSDRIFVDLANGNVVHPTVTATPPVGGIGYGKKGFTIYWPHPANQSKPQNVKLIAKNVATGLEAEPKWAGSYGGGLHTLERSIRVFMGSTLPPGTYTLRVHSSDLKKTLWFDGTKNGTTNASKAVSIEVKPYWGNTVGNEFVFDLAKTSTATEPTPKPFKFVDIPANHKFAKEINWMGVSGLSTGVKTAGGKAYQPKSNVTREAMAAFLYRLNTPKGATGPKGYSVPKTSPFADVKPGDKFFKEIAWMHASGLSTGNKQAAGKPTYAPKSSVSREAMAAFMFRMDAKSGYKAPEKSPFADVSTNHKFYKQIAWMSTTKLSTGYKQSNGSRHYQDKDNVSREAMAAFIYRSQH